MRKTKTRIDCHPEPAFFALTLILIFACSPASAQMRGVGSFGARPASGNHFRTSIVAGPQFAHSHGRNPFFPGAYFLGDTWLADDSYYAPQTQPPVVVIQPDSSTKESPPPSAVRSPLLIELQGDRYIRYGGSDPSSDLHASNAAPDYNGGLPAVSPARESRMAPAEQLPATLIFRDGRQEEAGNYAIVSGVIYLRSDYWTSGSWTRQIQLADLDIPATLKANRERGVKFALPSAPNEIVTRP